MVDTKTMSLNNSINWKEINQSWNIYNYNFIGQFYGKSTLVGLFHAKVFLIIYFSSNSMVLSKHFNLMIMCKELYL